MKINSKLHIYREGCSKGKRGLLKGKQSRGLAKEKRVGVLLQRKRVGDTIQMLIHRFSNSSDYNS